MVPGDLHRQYPVDRGVLLLDGLVGDHHRGDVLHPAAGAYLS